MAPAFAFSVLATRGGRIVAAVVGLAIGLPVLFWAVNALIPEQEEDEPHVRVEVKIRDARTGMYVNEALVRVYRKMGDRELPDMAPKQAVAGVVVLLVRPETARSESAYLRIDASGYAPYRDTLVALFERGETLPGEHIVTVELTPEVR